ncbi:pseudouridine synthase [Novispirillum sp. DQ9]|uniref:pseudouridine synthase n=1 Tax=Novispirillum sp. DQ9 TaxID=3398612 RepID=UPI003C7D066B
MTRYTPSPRPSPARIVAFHKPFDVLSQFTQEEPGQRTLAEFSLPPGLYPVGRLDRDSEGLLLLSNDGPFIKRALDPRHGHPRTYLAQVERVPDAAALAALRAGVDIRIDGKVHHTLPCQADLLDGEPDLPPRDPPIRFRKSVPTAWLRLVLTEGKNRQVRRMTAAVGFPTLRLVRVATGALTLDGLAPGQWREVTRKDVMG